MITVVIVSSFLSTHFTSPLPKNTVAPFHFCNTSSMPILLRFRGERNRLSSLSSSLSELRCTPAVAIAVEGGSWIGGMLEGPVVGARVEADVIGGK